MQELTFEQVEEVSGGLIGSVTGGSGSAIGPFVIDSFETLNQQEGRGGAEALGGTGGQTIAGSLIGATNYLGSIIVAGLSGTASGALGLVGFIASTAFSATQEGRDEMRIQNHPATRDLYNADGTRK